MRYMNSENALDNSYDVALASEHDVRSRDRSESLEPSETVRPLTDQMDLATARVFDNSDRTLFLRVMGRIGTRCTYAAMASTIDDVFRDEKWTYVGVISKAELVKKITNKLKTLNKHHTHQDLERQRYLMNKEWYEMVEERIVRRLKDASQPVRPSTSGSSNVRQSSRRIRYSDAEEKMFRHWMVTLTENAVGYIFDKYQGTRKREMLKHKLREVRKAYSIKEVKMMTVGDAAGSEAGKKAGEADGDDGEPEAARSASPAANGDKAQQVVSYHRLYKVDPAGHFDEVAKAKWVEGPIPEADVAAFRRRVLELKRESQPINTSDFDMLDSGSAMVGDEDFDASTFTLARGIGNVDETDRFISEHLRDATADLTQHGGDEHGASTTANLVEALRHELDSLAERPHPQNPLPCVSEYTSILQGTLKVCREILLYRQGTESQFSLKQLLEAEESRNRAALAQVQNYMSPQPSHPPVRPPGAAAAAVAAAVGKDGKESPAKRQKTR